MLSGATLALARTKPIRRSRSKPASCGAEPSAKLAPFKLLSKAMSVTVGLLDLSRRKTANHSFAVSESTAPFSPSPATQPLTSFLVNSASSIPLFRFLSAVLLW